MPVLPVAGLANSVTSSASSVGSLAASPFASVLGQAASRAASGSTGNSTGGSAASSAASSATNAIQQKANAALDSFRKQLQALLTANQIDASQPVQLQSDGQGGVNVVGDNPDAGQIKGLLQDHPDLIAQFTSLAQAFSALRAADPTQPNDSLKTPAFGVTFTGQQSTIAFS